MKRIRLAVNDASTGLGAVILAAAALVGCSGIEPSTPPV